MAKMKNDKEIGKIMDRADKEIQEICSKYSLTLTAIDNRVYLDHHKIHKRNDVSIRRRPVAYAPF